MLKQKIAMNASSASYEAPAHPLVLTTPSPPLVPLHHPPPPIWNKCAARVNIYSSVAKSDDCLRHCPNTPPPTSLLPPFSYEMLQS